MIKKFLKNPIVIVLLVILGILFFCALWLLVRSCSPQPEIENKPPVKHADYSDEEKAMNAISLSYFVYGLEYCENKEGTVAEIIANNTIGILEENEGLKRTNEKDPKTAAVDTAAFIESYVGDFAFINDRINEKSGFYAAAFRDDQKKCIWISYSGAVTFKDFLACAGIVIAPWMTSQENEAFDFFNEIFSRKDIKGRGYKVIFTGHSLGGLLATEVATVTDCEAYTINGADGIGYEKITEIYNMKFTNNNVTNLMTSKKGADLSWLSTIQRTMFFGAYKDVNYIVFEKNDLASDIHTPFSFIIESDEGYSLPKEYQDGNAIISEPTPEPTETPEPTPKPTKAPEITAAPEVTEVPEITELPDTTETPEPEIN